MGEGELVVEPVDESDALTDTDGVKEAAVE
jgi:hypothetical protein